MQRSSRERAAGGLTASERHDVITASIVGATGYTGAVLTDILAEHPEVGSRAYLEVVCRADVCATSSRTCACRDST